MNNNNSFTLENTDSLQKRILILTIVVFLWFISEAFLRPFLGISVSEFRNLFGKGPLASHIISQSLPVVFVSLIVFLILRKLEILPQIRIYANKRTILKEGILWGLLICVPTIPVALYLGFRLGFNPNYYSIIGNIFSNSYEEFVYRGLLFLTACYTFRNITAAALFSAILFAGVHTQYPVLMQIIVALAGLFFNFAFIRSHSLLAALLAHQIADMILDSILIQ